MRFSGCLFASVVFSCSRGDGPACVAGAAACDACSLGMLALQPCPCTESDAVCFHRLPAGQDFATRINNVFVIGRGDKPLISLPKGKGELLSDLADCLWTVHVT